MTGAGPSQRKGSRRLDAEIVARGLAETREQAQRLILAGQVSVAGLARVKPGSKVAPDTAIEVTATERYVSRGGLKLEAALRAFDLNPTATVCADIGASTGGFTDCLLQHGAARVYAVDVGRSQLHARLRADNRVVLVEQCNARHLTAQSLPEPVDLIVVDVSFISVTKIVPALASIARPGTLAVVLVKPQFEATRAEVSRGRGVIRDEAVRRRALRDVLAAAAAARWLPLQAVPCPVQGGSGNREWLLLLEFRADPASPNADALLDKILAADPRQPLVSALNIDAPARPACNSGVKENQPADTSGTSPADPQ